MDGYTDTLPDSGDTQAAIIALERHALKLWNDGDPDGFLELSADDIVYFDPSLGQKLEGKKALEAYYDSVRGKIRIETYEMIRPAVRLSAGTAVLTYDYEAHRDAQVFRMHCTEVYEQAPDGRWRIVHTHWSFAPAGD